MFVPPHPLPAEEAPPPEAPSGPAPTPEALLPLLDEGRFVEALDALGPPEQPWPWELWELRARALEGLGRRAEAVRAYGAAMAAAPPADADFLLARLLTFLEDLQEDELTEVVWGCPLCPETGYALLRWARMRHAAGDPDGADALLAAVTRDFPAAPLGDAAEELRTRWAADRAATPGLYGLLLPLSGPLETLGIRALRGALLASRLFRGESHPGIRLAVADSRGEPEAAALGVRELASRGVLGIVGPLRASAAEAAARVARELGVPLLAPTPSPAAAGDGVFRLYLREEDEVAQLVEYAVDIRGLARFAILYPDTPLGRRYRDLFWAEAVARGGEITAVEAFPSGSRDQGDAIRRLTGVYGLTAAEIRERFVEEERARLSRERALLAALGLDKSDGKGAVIVDPERLSRYKPSPIVDFDAVFLPVSGVEAAQIAPQFPFHDVDRVALLGIRTWNHPTLVQVGQEYVAGALFPAEFHPELPEARDFAAAYQAEHGEPPGVIEAYGYDAVRLLLGATALLGPDTRAGVRRRLDSLWAAQGVTGPLTAHPGGDVAAQAKILTVRRGRIVPAE